MKYSKMLLALVVMGMLFFPLVPERVTAQWSTDPTVNNAVRTGTGDQMLPAVISDGNRGGIISWENVGSGIDHSISLQRVDAFGTIRWTSDGVPVVSGPGDQRSAALLSDDSGGVIIAWDDSRGRIRAQRINDSGSVRWSALGVGICSFSAAGYPPAIAPDGTGGAIITWVDFRTTSSYHIYAQRINRSGVPQWTSQGVAVSTAAFDQIFPKIVSDGMGGAIITWYDLRSGTNYDVYAQRIDKNGVAQWTNNGVAISTAAEDQVSPAIIGDGAGGAIITWQDLRSGNNDIYAQRIDGAGSMRWTANGAAISTAANDQLLPIITTDGTGGAIITWQDLRSGNKDIYAQHIDSAGVVLWTANGVAIASGARDQASPAITSDHAGGATITWQDARNDTSIDIYAQRIDHQGLAMWATGGLLVSKASLDQTSPAIMVDETGGTLIAWQDGRNGTEDIYAQYIDRFGYYGFHAPRLTGVHDVPGDQGGQVTVAWQRSDLDVYFGFVNLYSVWVKIDSTPVPEGGSYVHAREMRSKGAGNGNAKSVDAPDTTHWRRLANVSATAATNYSVNVPTSSDSTSKGRAYFQFMVWAHSPDQSIFWDSNIDSGYSVDNTSPGPVSSVVADVRTGPSVLLQWPPDAIDPDVSHYEVHRSLDVNFKPGSLTRIGETIDTMFVDALPPTGIVNFYRVITVDAHENKSVPSVIVLAGVPGPAQYSVSRGWNMVSVALTVPDYHTVTLFPNSISSAYSYNDPRYLPSPVLANGVGYWIKYDEAQVLEMTGSARAVDTIPLVRGWNLFGSISTTIDTSKIISIPPGIMTSRFYTYVPTIYKAAATIEAGKGYWVKSTQSGKLILDANPHQALAGKIHILPTEELPPSAPEEIGSAAPGTQIPDRYELDQNFPNPFNPTTTLKYALPFDSNVRLTIFDLLGQVVVSLVDEVQQAGYRSVEWNASSLSSGIYFYRLEATSIGNPGKTFMQVRKTLFVK